MTWTAEEGLHCQSHLHRSEKQDFVLVQVAVREGAANRWIPERWCMRCLEEERLRRG